jgi:glucose/arabinose dehydrogenase
MKVTILLIPALLIPSVALAQVSTDPYPTPIRAEEGSIRVDYTEFAVMPGINGSVARMMMLVDDPGTRRLFVSDMRGPLYSVSYDGRAVALYVDTNDPKWGQPVQSGGRERGVQSFAFHPQFSQQGTPGHGKFYTWSDVSDVTRRVDFAPAGGNVSHHTALLEWTARTPAAATYDGDSPREIIRVQQPYSNHNGGQVGFNPLARPGTPEFGVLYIGLADGGSGGDPMNLAQNPASALGKILRIDPLGNNSRNTKYGIPADNPFVSGAPAGMLPEIYALGVRNPQRFGWDPANGAMYVADIGQNTVEEISPVTRGANLGWNIWEGSFRFGRGGVDTSNPRGDAAMTYPVAEFDHRDPLLSGGRAAITGVVVNRGGAIPQLANMIIFGDIVSGEVFAVSADTPPQGGQGSLRRVLFNSQGQGKTLLELIRARNTEQGRNPASRTDLRFGTGPGGRIFLLNKMDGVIRAIGG